MGGQSAGICAGTGDILSRWCLTVVSDVWTISDNRCISWNID